MKKINLTMLILAVFFIVVVLSCGGEKFPLPDQSFDNGGTAVGDTLYLQVNPIWGVTNGYDFNQPKDIIVGREPLIYIADTGNNRVLMLDLAGNVLGASRPVDDNTDPAQIKGPVALAQDTRLNLLILTDTNKIYRINLVAAGHDIANAPVELVYEEVDNPDRRYTGILAFRQVFQTETRIEYFVSATGADVDDNQILKFPEDFVVPIIPGKAATLTPNGFGMLSAAEPSGLTAVNDFTLDFIFCMVGQNNFKVQWLTPSEFGYVARLNPAKGNFDLLEPGKFSTPEDITVDEEGSIYIVDAGLHRLFKFSASGKELQSFGGPEGNVEQEFEFNQPSGVAVFDKTLYIADTGNNRIVRFKLSTDVTN